LEFDILVYGRDKFVEMVMRVYFPNQGKHGLLCAKKKNAIDYDGKNLFYLLKLEI